MMSMHNCNQLIEVQYNDVNAQHTNVTDSMKLRNTKPPMYVELAFARPML